MSDYMDEEYAYRNDDDTSINTESTALDLENVEEDEDEKYKRNPNLRKLSNNRGGDCYKVMISKRVKRRKKGKVTIVTKKVPIYFYETGTNPGATIRDAITGQYHFGYHVGKINDENQFYSVAYCVGDALKDGQKLGDNRDAQHLFFMNPESYERHFNTIMKPERKEAWYKMQIELKNKRMNG